MFKRKPISKKMRFEVFKRDKFRCKYCGKGVPDVVLHADHILPVSKGGKNTMLNLVTSCMECNLGKGATELSDMTIIEKQKEQLEALSEKDEQLKMLLKWRSGLSKVSEKELKACYDCWREKTGYGFTDHFGKKIKILLKKYGLVSVLDAMDIAEQYFEYEKKDPNEITDESFSNALGKLRGICYISSMPKEDAERYKEFGKIKWYVVNKFRLSSNWKVSSLVNAYKDAGGDIGILRNESARCNNINDWCEMIENTTEDIVCQTG